MPAADFRIRDLILKQLRDELSPDEYNELQNWVNRSEQNKSDYAQLTDPDRLRELYPEYKDAPDRIWSRLLLLLASDPAYMAEKSQSGKEITTRINKGSPDIAYSNPGTGTSKRSIRWYAAAACIAALLLVSGWLYFHPSRQTPALAPSATAIHDRAPGTDKATLTLANGSTILLQDAQNGALAKEGSTAISKDSNRLTYQARPAASTTAAGNMEAAISYNILATPRAGQYQVALPDGTHVWLNNASSLRFPSHFAGSTRTVELSGEAYFEVAKNAATPFIVKTDHLSVQVLGTDFDIMAYTDENNVKTTLISGSVSVQSAAVQRILHPGEQATLNNSANLTIQAVDADNAIAWIRGYFHFSNEQIGSVLTQLARWYDVELRLPADMPDYRFDGEIGRDLSLATILSHLEKSDLHFHIEGKMLIVTR